MPQKTDEIGWSQEQLDRFYKRLEEMLHSDLPEILKRRKLPYPDNIDEILAEQKMDPKALADGDRQALTDIYNVTMITAAIDIGNRDRKYPLTRKTCAVLAAAK